MWAVPTPGTHRASRCAAPASRTNTWSTAWTCPARRARRRLQLLPRSVFLRGSVVPGWRPGIGRHVERRADHEHGDPLGHQHAARRLQGELYARVGQRAELFRRAARAGAGGRAGEGKARQSGSRAGQRHPDDERSGRLAGRAVKRDKLWFALTWHDQRMEQHILGAYNRMGLRGSIETCCGTSPARSRGR